MRVLVVDDSPVLREKLVRVLSEIPCVEAFGHHAEEQAVLELIKTMRPETLIFDAQVSGGRGLAMLRKIKQEGEHLPTILVFSNETEDAYKEKYLKAGADYFFDKTKGLKQIIDKFLELAEQTKTTNNFTAQTF